MSCSFEVRAPDGLSKVRTAKAAIYTFGSRRGQRRVAKAAKLK